MILYSEHILKTKEKYSEYTFSDFETEKEITQYNYEGMGYGYRLKKIAPKKLSNDKIYTPLLDKIFEKADAI